jgi:hypothetical protein
MKQKIGEFIGAGGLHPADAILEAGASGSKLVDFAILLFYYCHETRDGRFQLLDPFVARTQFFAQMPNHEIVGCGRIDMHDWRRRVRADEHVLGFRRFLLDERRGFVDHHRIGRRGLLGFDLRLCMARHGLLDGGACDFLGRLRRLLDDFGAGFVRGARRGEQIERRNVEINFINIDKIARLRKLKNSEIPMNGGLRPAERVKCPSKELGIVAAPEALFDFVQMPISAKLRAAESASVRIAVAFSARNSLATNSFVSTDLLIANNPLGVCERYPPTFGHDEQRLSPTHLEIRCRERRNLPACSQRVDERQIDRTIANLARRNRPGWRSLAQGGRVWF